METAYYWLEYKLLEEKCRTILDQLKATSNASPALPLAETKDTTYQIPSAGHGRVAS